MPHQRWRNQKNAEGLGNLPTWFSALLDWIGGEDSEGREWDCGRFGLMGMRNQMSVGCCEERDGKRLRVGGTDAEGRADIVHLLTAPRCKK